MKTLIVLLGPTGVGKTELSLSLAEFFHIPILNADSRQLFRDLPIGNQQLQQQMNWPASNTTLSEH